jgi:FtsP/CotA-like multicopper oxidase with cupredoxin domain
MVMRQHSREVLGSGSAWPKTPLWMYEGNDNGVAKLNPTIHVDQGQPIRITQVNGLPATHPKHGYTSDTSVHLHGSGSKPQYDGYAADLIRVGQRKVYEYPNQQGARTLWYHDHAAMRTATNAYAGLAGQYHLHDAMEAQSGIPTGAFDIPVTIRDALFARDGSLHWDDHDRSSFMGDVILVNNVPWPVLPVQKRRYRFRILNASVSRSLRLSLNDPRATMWVIATDGGFLPKPVQVSNIRVGMAERYEVIIDFTGCTDNAQVIMRSASVQNNVDYLHTNKVMAFRVGVGRATDVTNNADPAGIVFYQPSVGTRPTSPDYTSAKEVMQLTESMAVKRRSFRFRKEDTTGEWTIDGDTWNEVIKSDYRRVIANPMRNDIEVWEFTNNSGGWFHPVHVHLIDFKLLSRTGTPLQAYEKGPKDVVYVGEGETVKMVARFGPHEGRYMIHCHNIVHEDHDMMAQFRVGPPRGSFPDDPNDPIGAHPAYDDGDASNDYDA